LKLDQSEFLFIVKNAPLVAIDLIIESTDGAALLGYRKNEPAKNHWFVPGGRINKDEVIESAFSRITRAELGSEFASDFHYGNAMLMGAFEHHYATNFANAPGFGTHIIVLAYRLRTAKIDPLKLADDQHSRFRWFTLEEIASREDVHKYTKAYFQW
jgi:colanic acid biosynthesis protein WcaH